MEPNALLVMILIAGFVWGGFLLILVVAMRKESAKLPTTLQDSPEGLREEADRESLRSGPGLDDRRTGAGSDSFRRN